jgi:hypothetical protein
MECLWSHGEKKFDVLQTKKWCHVLSKVFRENFTILRRELSFITSNLIDSECFCRQQFAHLTEGNGIERLDIVSRNRVRIALANLPSGEWACEKSPAMLHLCRLRVQGGVQLNASFVSLSLSLQIQHVISFKT